MTRGEVKEPRQERGVEAKPDSDLLERSLSPFVGCDGLLASGLMTGHAAYIG